MKIIVATIPISESDVQGMKPTLSGSDRRWRLQSARLENAASAADAPAIVQSCTCQSLSPSPMSVAHR